MKVFSEWHNSRIKMGFQEKYSMFLQRLSTLSSMKTQADMALKSKPGTAIMNIGIGLMSGGCYGCGGSSDKTAEELVSEVDLMWKELKKEIVSSVSEAKSKADAKKTEEFKD